MRIIGGEMRSRRLLSPKGMDTRPTRDSVREALFNILRDRCEGAKVLDLYAGSGALALEAVSRGAESAALCDSAPEAIRAIRANISSLGVGDKCRLLPMTDRAAIAKLAASGDTFDLVFLDPPYRLDASAACGHMADAGILARDALIVIEHADDKQPAPDTRFAQIDRRRYGGTAVTFYRYGG